jgi:hypothetical protein
MGALRPARARRRELKRIDDGGSSHPGGRATAKDWRSELVRLLEADYLKLMSLLFRLRRV